jgi:superfamily II DNA or RNA helicase
LEASPAIARLGLTATIAPLDPLHLSRIAELVGSVVFELTFADLVGEHLAPLTVRRIAVSLESDERIRYETAVRPYRDFARAFFSMYPRADYEALRRALLQSTDGRRMLSVHAEAMELAAFPRAKRQLVRRLLETHRHEKVLVFTAFIENAYDLARENLIPVICGETQAAERREVLERFSVGRYRVVASSRVLNEGIDVPDASVAIIVAGTLGAREHVQRIGRVVRPAEGKRALVYEVITADTADERRAGNRRKHAPRSAH